MEMKKVVVVDDDDLVLIALRELLSPMNYAVVTSLTGEDALEKLSGTKFDLMILDIAMPDMDGYELCRKIREIEGYYETPVIMLTAKSSDEDRLKGLQAGANLFLPKPFSPERLLSIIDKAMK
jgi:DNA-binding response OmpR family regulator